MRFSCLELTNIDILGVAENHLAGESVLSVTGYTWFGQNRKRLHVRARTGSGGIGFLVRNEIMENFHVVICDDSYEGILWIKLQDKLNKSDVLYSCVCYLPPINSTRTCDANEYFDMLINQIHIYGKDAFFYICGDFNSRCSEMEDFIPGIDILPERKVLDFTANAYGENMCDFCINANCCILNGRNSKKDNFTFVSTQSSSVVDYCLVPYEAIEKFTNFEVLTVTELTEKTQFFSQIDSITVKPDHSLLMWDLNVNTHDIAKTVESNEISEHRYLKFDVQNTPNHMFQDNIEE